MQVAHFLEADLQPWGAALAAALFATEPKQPSDEASTDAGALICGSVARSKGTWEHLEELKPLGDAVDAVLRGWRLPLREQVLRTPAEWQPVVIGSHAVAGALELTSDDTMACGDNMQAVHTVHTCTVHLNWPAQGKELYAISAAGTLPELRALHLRDMGRTATAVFGAHASRFSALTRLDLRVVNATGGRAAEIEAALSSLHARLEHLQLEQVQPPTTLTTKGYDHKTPIRTSLGCQPPTTFAG